MNLKTIALTSSALTAALLLAGCTGSGGHTGMDMGGSASTSSATATSAHNAADIAFVQNMVAHHRQAIEMSGLVLSKTDANPHVVELAQAITAAQQPEIDTMNGWLSTWGAHAGMSHDMGGMMPESDLDALRKASGAEAGRLFLTQMIEHHQGAIDMAEKEVEDGENTDAVALAKRIISDQTAEIAAMQSLLAAP